MKYQMRQRLWTFGQKFGIENEQGREVYFVEGKVFSIGDKLSFQDASGQELAYIEQQFALLKRVYRLHRDSRLFATIEKEFTFFRDHYTVDVPGPNDYSVHGDFFSHEYRFERQGQVVATVSKTYFALADTYGIDIVDGEDDITILATTVVIDLVNDDKGGHGASASTR